MQELSNLNDLAGLWTLLATVAVAATVFFFLARRQPPALFLDFRFSTRAYAICLVIAAVWITVQFVFLEPDMLPWGGGDRYFPRALNVVQQGVFGSGSSPTALFPPGYSFLLVPAIVALGDSPWTFFLTNLVLLIGHSLVLRAILIRIGVSTSYANLLAAILVLYPNRLFGTLLPFSDVSFSLFWMTAFGLVLASNRSPRSLILPSLAGMWAGTAALIRSAGLLYLSPLLAGILVSASEGKGRRALLFIAFSATMLIPWSARNFFLFGTLVPVSTNAGYNLLIGNNPMSGAGWNRYVDTSSAVAAALRDAGGKDWSEVQRDSFYARLAAANILQSPGTTTARAGLKVARTLGTDGYSFGLLETYTNAREITIDMVKDSPRPRGLRRFVWALYSVYYQIIFILGGAFYYVLAGLTLQGLWAERHRRRDAWWVMILLLLCVILVVSLTFGLSRYKEPISAALLVYLGTRLSQTREQDGRRSADSRDASDDRGRGC